MLRKIIFTILPVGLVALTMLSIKNGTAVASNADTSASTDLVCNDQRVRDYERIQILAGRMTVGPSSHPGTLQEHRAIHKKFKQLSFVDGKTYFVVAHKSTGDIFPVECTKESCSFYEVNEPMSQCKTKHYDNCMYFAVRFHNENFCLQQPAMEKNE